MGGTACEKNDGDENEQRETSPTGSERRTPAGEVAGYSFGKTNWGEESGYERLLTNNIIRDRVGFIRHGTDGAGGNPDDEGQQCPLIKLPRSSARIKYSCGLR